MKVFIQNEAGSDQKHYHNEETLEWKGLRQVSRRYPFPYGFVVGTTAPDGCNVDCFVLTKEQLRGGQTVECEPIGLMEQIEDGQEDHNVLAVLEGENPTVDETVRADLTDFVGQVFADVEGKQIRIGRFLGREAALAHLSAHRDDAPPSGPDHSR